MPEVGEGQRAKARSEKEGGTRERRGIKKRKEVYPRRGVEGRQAGR